MWLSERKRTLARGLTALLMICCSLSMRSRNVEPLMMMGICLRLSLKVPLLCHVASTRATALVLASPLPLLPYRHLRRWFRCYLPWFRCASCLTFLGPRFTGCVNLGRFPERLKLVEKFFTTVKLWNSGSLGWRFLVMQTCNTGWNKFFNFANS
ncbi:hypothetical protein Gbem_4105 [Citrifermentans bemidjiense Bem]|uniref:Uncharacterized protein n=1 Tax=Citrifermentans bemidjiense (strain ATCC BAA-1014 / DSM 16622 / JCM 12645 / Bem) TaxID=404380 RepID=E1P6A9_CITBB|nr:hypothetical protein Gbem_4105 [Citrifermentans bemidjiense Bem]